MENAREFTLATLVDLINICKKEHRLFTTASNKTSNPYLKSTLDNCANEKDKNIHKLESELQRLGGKCESKNVQTSQDILEELDPFNDDKEILTKCEEIDNIVLSKYSKAMNGDILWEVVPLVAKQYFASVNLHCKIMYSFKSGITSTVYS